MPSSICRVSLSVCSERHFARWIGSAGDCSNCPSVDLEARRPTSAKLAQVVAPTESGVVVATFWESAEAREAYQSEPEHREALQASGLLDSVTEMRSRVFEDAELKLA